jgi:hypothetical protein
MEQYTEKQKDKKQNMLTFYEFVAVLSLKVGTDQGDQWL